MGSARRRTAILCAALGLGLGGAPGAAAVDPGDEPSVSVYTERLPTAEGHASPGQGGARSNLATPPGARSSLSAVTAGVSDAGGLALAAGLAAVALGAQARRRTRR